MPVCIDFTSDTALATCRVQLNRYVRRRPSSVIRLAICVSISLSYTPQRAGPILLFMAIDRTSQLMYAELHKQMMHKDAVGFLEAAL